MRSARASQEHSTESNRFLKGEHSRMEFKWSTKGFDDAKALADVYRPAALRALNRLADSSGTFANRTIRTTYNLTRAQVDPCISVLHANGSNLTAVIKARGRRLPIHLFGAKMTPGGVRVAIKIGQAKVLPWAFIPKGWQVAFRRTGEFRKMTKGRYVGKRREVLDPVRTISVAAMFGNLKIKEALDSFASDKFPGLLQHELEYYTSRSAPSPDKSG